MHEVHAELARLKHERSPLERIAARIAREVRVLCFDELYVADIADAMILGTLFAALFGARRDPGGHLQRAAHGALQGRPAARALPAGHRAARKQLEVLRLPGSTDYRLRQLTQAGIYLPAGAPATTERLQALFAHPGRSGRPGRRHDGDRGPADSRRPRQRQRRLVRFRRPVRRAAQPGGLHRDRARVPVGAAVRRAGARCPARGRGAPLHRARRRALRPQRQPDRVRGRAPAALYRGERLGALFERTASRLIEMQSEEYLAREHRP